MWQMKEWFLKFVVQAVWRRRKGVYYAVSVVSIAGNLVVLVGPSVQASIVLHSGALQAAWSALPHVAEVVLHRSVLCVLLNLIVVRIVVKSGVLRHTPGIPAKPDEFCLPSSYYGLGYYGVRGLPWPAAVNNTCTVYGMQSAPVPGVPMFTDTSKRLQQARHDDRNSTKMVDVCAQKPALQHPSISINKSICSDQQLKCVPAAAPSLFTIEPLDELVQTTESYTVNDDQAHIDKTLKRPLRKVASRRVDLHRSTQAQTRASKSKGCKKAEQLHKQKEEQSMELVLAKQEDGGGGEKANAVAEEEDNNLSRQEFNERVDTFIFKFKRSLTMQRQDSLNRLLGGLVGGGGDIRVIK